MVAASGVPQGRLVFTDGFTPRKPWAHAMYKAPKGGKLPSWEVSWQRFQQGREGLFEIASRRENGKARRRNPTTPEPLPRPPRQ